MMSPFNVADRSQLFVDQLLVRETRNVSFTLHPAKRHPENPIMRADQPWEGWRLELYGNVIYDEQERIFKMWYLGEELEAFPHFAVYYATSEDGIHWVKPLVGTVHTSKYARHNAVADNALLASVMKDNAEPDPCRRYKMICFLERERGYHTMVSPDGLTWTRCSEERISPGGDVITAYYDERREMYVAFAKILGQSRGHLRRLFWLVTSKDFETWSEPKLVFEPDLRDDVSSLARIEEVRPILDVPDDPKLMRTDFYGIGAYPAESCTLAFVWLLTINNNCRYNPKNHEGPGELQLAVSRDLEHWERPFRIPCVPRGRLGEWDCGFFCTQSRALDVGDEVWLYYGGGNYTHGAPCLYLDGHCSQGTQYTGSLGLAIWQRDRFVSVDAPAGGGWLLTVPVTFSSHHLEINSRCKPRGSIIVRLLDAAGKPIPGYEASDPIRGDSLRHVVTWSGNDDVTPLVGAPVALKFEMKSADLFAFAFRQS